MLSKLKPEFKENFIAFGGKGRVNLGDRDDLDKLVLAAIRGNDKGILSMFQEPLPTEEELTKDSVKADLSATVAAMKTEIKTPAPAASPAGNNNSTGNNPDEEKK